ncbi:MAG TPA: hypothetical protein VGO09_06890, partial [Flavisolibacter sp.]|nr:hypothetical protein [Flavisolibacter sp.]
MRCYKFFLLAIVLCASKSVFTQKIIYSEPEREDGRRMNFEVIGKLASNFLIYKNIHNKSFIAIYNNNMVEVNKEELDYLPTEKIINIDFFPYQDFSYLIYEYQKKNIIYCNAVKIDEQGKKISDIIQLDTTHIGFAGNNKIYSTISSEDKSKLMVFKINSRNRSKYMLTTLLFDDKLELQKKSRLFINMDEHNDYLDEFNVDNGGDLVFAKYNRSSNETINMVSMVLKSALSDSLSVISIPLDKIYLDELHIKVDNPNKRFFLTSFYYRQKRGNIEGFYFYVLDKNTLMPVLQNSVVLSEELRKEARGDANSKMAFNDYFIRNIIIKRDGGFIINSEAYYTTSRYNSWNRWNYLYGMPYNSYDYYSSYSPYYSSLWWRNRYDNSQAVRYHADNITILSFDKNGTLQWSDVIHKDQFDDESDDRVSYELANTGN